LTSALKRVRLVILSFFERESPTAPLRCFFLFAYIPIIMNNKNNRLQEYIKNIIEYDPESGNFWWLQEKQGRDLNVPAGTETAAGYRIISIDGKGYAAHRLAFLFMEGAFPPAYVDHKDGNPRNNKWDNLRHASAKQNAQNKRRKYNSFTGMKGVIKNHVTNLWEVRIDIDGKRVSEGPFYSYQKACKRYDELAEKNFGEFYRKEEPRQQKATFSNEDVTQAVEDFIKNKRLVNGHYISDANRVEDNAH